MRYITGLLGLLCLGATAQAQEIRGVYAGLSLGYLSYEESGDNLGVPISEGASAYRIVGGYQFNSVYALEAGWGESGTFTERFGGFDQSGEDVSLELSGEYELATLRFIATAPFSSFGMFGGAGYYDATLKASSRFQSSAGINTASGEDTDDGLTVVGGVQYEFDRIALRGEYEWFDTDDGVETQSINVTAIFRF